jgi:uncharacterized protein (TIGR00369 family)
MDIQTLARQIFEAQPFSRLVGAQLVEVGSDSAEIQLKVRDDLTQQHGYVHGGVISYLADNALTFAGGIALGGDALTAEFKINYLRPARGHLLIARAKAIGIGRRQAVTQCEILVCDHDGKHLCAVAQGTVVGAGSNAESKVSKG